MRRVGGALAVALEGASSEEMVNSTSSMQISTFSSLKSTLQLVIRSNVAIMRRIVPVWITPQKQCMQSSPSKICFAICLERPESTTDISCVNRQKEAIAKTKSIPETTLLESMSHFARCFNKR